MYTKIQNLLDDLTDAGLSASIWRSRRIYLNGYGKDIKAYFDYPDGGENGPMEADPFAGARLRVFSNCNQGRQWLINRAKQVKHSIMEQLQESGLMKGVCDDWQQVVL